MPQEQVEFDHHPEVVEAGKGARRLELLGVKEKLAEPDSRRRFFAGVDDERFTKLLGYVNSITRGQTISYEYEDGQAPSLTTPPLEDKAPLMRRTFDTVRAILAQDALDDRSALRRAALTIAGAVNYVHPYNNGNGRTGRVVHYLMEFGSERGDGAFDNELYAIIGKMPVYSTHYRRALIDTPPRALTRALDSMTREQDETAWALLDDRGRASARVGTFLSMMRRDITVPIREPVKRVYRDLTTGARQPLTSPAGAYDGYDLYEADYLGSSAVPNYAPRDVPAGSERVMADRPSTPPETSSLLFDIISEP